MKLKREFVTKLFTPNVPIDKLGETFVDTGNLVELKKSNLNLGHGASFLVIGRRGSGKTILFQKLLIDMFEALEPQYQKNKTLWKKIKLAFPFKTSKKESSPILELPVYIIVKKNDVHLKETFIQEIIKEITKCMLLINELSKDKHFSGKEELLRILSLVKGTEIKDGRECGINLGGIWIPITLKTTETQVTVEKITDLSQYYDLLKDVLQIINRNICLIPHFIIFLDEFDKLKENQGKSLLRDHQGILFESFRKYCSFLIPCDIDLEKRYNINELKGVFNAPHFRIKPFGEEETKELIDNRLKVNKSGLDHKKIITYPSLRRIVRCAEGAPRIILESIRDEILKNECEIPI